MGKPYSDEVRAAALAALLAGQSVSAVAREHRLSRKTLITWRDTAGLGSTHVPQEKRAEIGDRVIAHVDGLLVTLQAIAATVNDPAWLKKYSPAEVGTLYGILADKAIYLGATLEPPEDEDQGAP